jgi:hypothetical protein
MMNEDIHNDKAAAQEKLSKRASLYRQGLDVVGVAAKGGRVALTSTLKGSMPLLEAYAGVTAKGLAEGDENKDGERILDLNHGQSGVVKAAGGKLFHEMLEIASITHPVYDGAPVYAVSVDGIRQTPHLVHFLALAAAAQEIFDKGEQQQPLPDTPQPQIYPDRSVAYLSVAPGEYVAATGPQSITQIRRAAMRERSLNQPQFAMMASNNQPVVYSSAQAMTTGHKTQIVPFTAANRYSVSGAGSGRAMTKGHGGCGSGCSCGCSCQHGSGGCSCGKCGHHTFGAARYLDDGTCAPTGTVSCETRWRLRDCVKFAFCDMLRCMGDEMCDDDCKLKEESDIGACVETFLCSLINCLPEAICPPEKPVEQCCHGDPKPVCGCNFAVEE